MILEDAYQFLGLATNSTESERFAMYEDTRNKLEAKLAKAPTPGLKEKYRKTIRELDEAIEAIENSVDGGDLPTLTRSADIGPSEEPAPAPESQQASRPEPRVARKSYKGEMMVAAMVIGIMIVGGWMYFNNQNQQSAVKNDLPQLRENIERAQQELRDLDSQSSDLDIDLGEEIKALMSGGTNAKLDANLEKAERYGSMEDWSAASTEMEQAETGLKTLNQALLHGTDTFNTQIAAIRKTAVEIYPEGSAAQMLLALSSGNRIDVNKPGPTGGRADSLDVRAHAFFYAAYAASDDGALGMSSGDAMVVAERLLQIPEVDVNIKNRYGDTFLLHVVRQLNEIYGLNSSGRRNMRRLMDLLIDHPDVDVNARDHQDYSALFVSADSGELVSKLLSHPDINVNAKQAFGEMPELILAIQQGRVETVRLLLAHPQIRVYDVTEEGENALQWAKSDGNPEIIRMVKQAMGQ